MPCQQASVITLRRPEAKRLCLDPSHVLCGVALRDSIRARVGWIVKIRIVEKIVDALQNHLHSDRRLPSLLVVEDREAHLARRVDVRVKAELREGDLRRLGRVV